MSRLWSKFTDEQTQLDLALETPPANAAELLDRLRAEGLRAIDRLVLTRNRAVMVSFRRGVLRLHQEFLGASPALRAAIVAFIQGRTRAERAEARRAILGYHIDRPLLPARRQRTRPDAEPLARRLTEAHAALNAEHFGGALKSMEVRISHRMKSRLGHYRAKTAAGDPAELVISRGHIRRHGWDEALHTLLHEMVHQWQDENALAIDHGAIFRKKARELGITPSARRSVPSGTSNSESAARRSVGIQAARSR